ncbi:hypothetical protein A7982_14008 [Minicystis rosea]|nr:hypothetical protein A7982_14008 [Minicystis rosea]
MDAPASEDELRARRILQVFAMLPDDARAAFVRYFWDHVNPPRGFEWVTQPIGQRVLGCQSGKPLDLGREVASYFHDSNLKLPPGNLVPIRTQQKVSVLGIEQQARQPKTPRPFTFVKRSDSVYLVISRDHVLAFHVESYDEQTDVGVVDQLLCTLTVAAVINSWRASIPLLGDMLDVVVADIARSQRIDATIAARKLLFQTVLAQFPEYNQSAKQDPDGANARRLQPMPPGFASCVQSQPFAANPKNVFDVIVRTQNIRTLDIGEDGWPPSDSFSALYVKEQWYCVQSIALDETRPISMMTGKVGPCCVVVALARTATQYRFGLTHMHGGGWEEHEDDTIAFFEQLSLDALEVDVFILGGVGPDNRSAGEGPEFLDSRLTSCSLALSLLEWPGVRIAGMYLSPGNDPTDTYVATLQQGTISFRGFDCIPLEKQEGQLQPSSPASVWTKLQRQNASHSPPPELTMFKSTR